MPLGAKAPIFSACMKPEAEASGYLDEARSSARSEAGLSTDLEAGSKAS